MGPGFFIFFSGVPEAVMSCTYYLTLAEADAINAAEPIWTGASDEDRQTALDYGYKYLQAYYSCSYDCEVDSVVPDALKEANAILALAHLTTPLWGTVPSKETVRSKSVNPGNGVAISKSYSEAQQTVKDPYLEVSLLLQGTCILRVNKAIHSMVVSRS